MSDLTSSNATFHFPDLNKQGNYDQDQQLSGPDAVRNAVEEISGQATRSIRILSHDLEPLIYDQQPFLDNLLNMARGNRFASIQILVADSSLAVKRGHGLIRLARKLTSAMQFRILPQDYDSSRNVFLLVDQCGFVYRSDYSSMQGIMNAQCEFRSKILADEFDRAWELGQHDPQTQNIYI